MTRQTDFKGMCKKPVFYLGWLVTLLPIFACIPLLLRMLRHTLTYSGQTVLADGIALYGQTPPSYFLSSLADAHADIRQTLYYCYRFLLPIIALWLFGGLLYLVVFRICLSLKEQTGKRLVSLGNEQKFMFGLLAGMMTLLVSYTYTLVRADKEMILSRTAPVLTSIGGVFLIVLLLHFGQNMLTRFRLAILLGLLFSTPFMLYHQVDDMKFPNMWTYPNGTASLVMDDSSKLFSHFEVPQGFVRMDEIAITDTSSLGNGFMVADQVSYLSHYEAVMKKCNEISSETYYMGFDGQGFYYYVNARACATGFIQAAKGYAAQQGILKIVKEKRPVIFLMEPQSTYYVYYWMMTSDYVYSACDEAFFPRELYTKIYPGNGDDYRLAADPTDFGLICSSFGNSYDTLSPLFTQTLPAVHDTETIVGTNYDFLYLSLTQSFA